MLVACNGDGSDDTSGSTSTTVTAPTITTQPTALSVTTGSSASLAVVASGSSLSYQWYKDSAAISGGTAATYTISSAATSDAGTYYVTVSNTAGSVTSSSATLTVTTATVSNPTDCSSGTYVENVVCAVTALEATLTSTQLAALQYDESSYTTAQLNVYKTYWTNLPNNTTRYGLTLGSLTTSDQTAAYYAVADAALSDAGYAEYNSTLAADDYLGTLTGGYGSSGYRITVVGTPSTTGLWTLMIGGHHMAFNLTFNNGVLYPTPRHAGVEPKAAFTVNGSTYQVLANKAATMLAVFVGQTNSLSPTTAGSTLLTSAYLSGQTFSDVLVGPVEYKTGSYTAVAAKYPTSNRGVLVSSLTAEQQALVTAAITQWVNDYDPDKAAQLIADYTSADAYANTYVAWAAPSGSVYPNVDVNTTYMRIDGPRAWIEIACQGGLVIQGITHYHMIFRDKVYDYYNELAAN
jgi:hypothetical protein